ncbi:MAG: phage tail tape measure protein, partial [Clostridia bacterium]|nr:phage tail tape measure protein [Clostridia bacterium]
MADEVAELVVKITGDASDLESTINGVASELSKLEKAQGGGNSVTASGTKGLEAYGQQLQNTGKSIKDFGEGLDTVTKPLQYTAAALATGGVAAAKFAIDFEDSFASVKKTVDGTPEQLDAIKQSIIDMSTVGINGHSAIPMTTAELNELAAAGGQLGIQTENIADFTEVMAQMGTATNLVGEEGAATLARFMNVMGISQGEIRNVGSAIVDLGNNSATTESEIAAMALRMGKYGSTIGMSAADVLGYSAALSSLGIEAQMGGSAIGRTWLSIESAVASGGDALNAFAKYSGKSAKEFKEQWNTDSKGAFNGLLKGLQSADNLTLALDKLGINNTQDIQAMMALVNGYDLVAESVERANTAYQENTALQAEFDAKAETTASQLAIVKNNFVEVARSVGETMLPTIKDASAGLADWAQKLASMDDSQKKTLVNTAAGVVALGVASKGLSAGVKTVGNFAEGIGKLTSAAPGIAAVAPEIGIIVAGITALGVAGKVTYDKLYEAEYKWADDMQESAEAISKNAAEVTKLTDLQKEVSGLKLVINSPDSSTEQVETAQQRIKEIAELLSEEYNLKINADTADVESALNLLEMEKRRDFMDSGSDYLETMRANRDSYIEAPEKISGLDKDLNTLEQQKLAYEDIASSLGNLKRGYDAGTISQKEYLDGFVDLLNKAEQTEGFDGWELAQGAVGNEDPATGLQNALTFATNLEKMIEKLGGEYSKTKTDYDNLTETQRIFEESAKFAAQGYSQVLASDILNGNWGDVAQVTQAFQTLGKEMKAAGANTDDVAKEFATAKQGFTDFQKAIDAGAGDAMANDFIEYKKSIGDTAEEAVRGAALIKSGFSDVSQVTAETLPAVLNNMRELGNAQGLDMTAEKLTQMAQAIKLIPQNTKIEFDGEGNIVLKVDDTEVEEYEAPDKPGKAPYSPDTSQVDAWTPPTKQGTVTYVPVLGDGGSNFNKFNASGWDNFAKGTTDAPGGLAIVNDEKGIVDPTELIKHGNAYYMLEGRDVPVVLDKHDKVYTAAQTKAIMSGLGIPHYAEGKNNSDAFTAAKDDYSHYTKTHAVTTAEQLEKWLEFQEQYKENEKDIWDIEEQIFSLQQKLYSERVKESENWLAHEEKYNGMGVDDYLAGIDRMKAYTEEYYAQGIISHKEYTDAMLDLDEKYIDKRKEQLE